MSKISKRRRKIRQRQRNNRQKLNQKLKDDGKGWLARRKIIRTNRRADRKARKSTIKDMQAKQARDALSKNHRAQGRKGRRGGGRPSVPPPPIPPVPNTSNSAANAPERGVRRPIPGIRPGRFPRGYRPPPRRRPVGPARWPAPQLPGPAKPKKAAPQKVAKPKKTTTHENQVSRNQAVRPKRSSEVAALRRATAKKLDLWHANLDEKSAKSWVRSALHHVGLPKATLAASPGAVHGVILVDIDSFVEAVPSSDLTAKMTVVEQACPTGIRLSRSPRTTAGAARPSNSKPSLKKPSSKSTKQAQPPKPRTRKPARRPRPKPAPKTTPTTTLSTEEKNSRISAAFREATQAQMSMFFGGHG